MRKKRHFRTTTDTSLTKAQKLEIIEAIERGVARLKESLLEFPELDSVWTFDSRLFFAVCDHNRAILRVWGDLTMGYIQSRYVYRYERKDDVSRLSERIASKTGASKEIVQEAFMEMMSEFIKERGMY